MEKKKNTNIIFGGLLVLVVVIVGSLIYFANNSGSTTDAKEDLQSVALPQLSTEVGKDEAEVQFQTTAGNINIKLFPKLAPMAVENFLALAKEGYYKDNEFFRVINNFMIQTGDPSNKGTGSKSVVNNNKPFATEISNQLYNIRGAVSLANSGPGETSSSQFFIVQNPKAADQGLTTEKYPEKIIEAYKQGGAPFLDGQYTVFGQVISGMDVVDKIAAGKVTTNPNNPQEESSPVNPEKITGVKIIKGWDF
ncbi:peptidylprolyl isomerase [Lactococcus ileimucosae]|uniref:peptidylprolyl isomerase n=1 Tax=Lactococcus ileimucosae TaxID=2941329 RepID=UPI0020436298|nr:peptidylprolyl isomerase [Lactococcus ileimucosae]